jgi:HD-GYP domain-containing protein (c-di-GMP phosphodiesterase class II)
MQAAQELLKTLYTMAMMVETRDAYTGGHLWRVSRFSGLLAQELALPRGEVLRIMLGGFLHDLGQNWRARCHSQQARPSD